MTSPAPQPMPAWSPEARPAPSQPDRAGMPPASAPEPWINTPAPQPIPAQAGLRQPQPVPAWQPKPVGQADSGAMPMPAPVSNPQPPAQEAPVRRILTQTVPRTVPLEEAGENPATASSAIGQRSTQAAVPAYDPTPASGAAATRFSYDSQPALASASSRGSEASRHRRVRTPSAAPETDVAEEANDWSADANAANWTREAPTPPSPGTRVPTARGYAYPMPHTSSPKPPQAQSLQAQAPLSPSMTRAQAPQPAARPPRDAQPQGQSRPKPQEQGQPFPKETAGVQPAWHSDPATAEPSAERVAYPAQPGELQWQLPQTPAPAIPLSANWTSPQADAPARGLDAPALAANAYPLPQMTGGFSADALDEDSGRYDAVIHQPLAEPMPVPTFGREPRARGKHRSGPWLIALTVIVLLAAGGYALYRTGIATQWMQQLFPSTTAGDTVPAVFQQTAASQQTTITPATQVDKVEQFSITVEPQSAAVPASLVFTVRTNTAATAVRLLTESGTVIRTNASYFRQEDALVWQVSATIEAAYTGKVRVFLRDAAGGWSEGGQDCQITVQ